MSGRQLEHELGHAIHMMLLKRELLCIFRACYDFIQSSYDKPVKIWKSVAKEAQWAAALLRLCYCDLRQPWDPMVSMSDASLTGIAVTVSKWELEQVRDVCTTREKWRYVGRNPLNQPRSTALGQLDPLTDILTVKPLPKSADDQSYDYDEYEPNPEFK